MDSDLLGTKLGNYRLQRLLGRGRMGVVYLARDEALLRPTAVKILSWANKNTKGHDPVHWFLREARTIARLNHPGIVQIYNIAKHRNYYYIAMEYIEGDSVESVVQKDGPFSPDGATEILLQAAEALHAAHQAGVVHRDIKPANLLMTLDGIVKLTDFGMALDINKTTPMFNSNPVGTPYYMATELWRHQSASPASDIYSLGCTYFTLLTGSPPFTAPSVEILRARHLESIPPDPRSFYPNIPKLCTKIVRRCLAKQPQRRYPTARDLSWIAKGFLQELEATQGADSDIMSIPMVNFSNRTDIAGRSYRRARGKLAKFFGFERNPFDDLDPRDCPYRDEPMVGVKKKLEKSLDDSGVVILLTGASGSGRSVLCWQLVAEQHKKRLMLYLDMDTYRGTRTPLQRIRRAVGAVPNSLSQSDGEIANLLERFGVAYQTYKRPPVVIFDGRRKVREDIADLDLLIRASVSTKSFNLILTGLPTLAKKLAHRDLRTTMKDINLPGLDCVQTLSYIKKWIEATQAEGAPLAVLSPDAGLLVGYLSEGNLSQINRISANMFFVAALQNRRVITSWDAWVGAQQKNRIRTEEDLAPKLIDLLSVKSPDWPGPDALKIINECRSQAGFSPLERKS